jgi:hypothetical protein
MNADCNGGAAAQLRTARTSRSGVRKPLPIISHAADLFNSQATPALLFRGEVDHPPKIGRPGRRGSRPGGGPRLASTPPRGRTFAQRRRFCCGRAGAAGKRSHWRPGSVREFHANQAAPEMGFSVASVVNRSMPGCVCNPEKNQKGLVDFKHFRIAKAPDAPIDAPATNRHHLINGHP